MSQLVKAVTQYQEGAAAISRITQAERLSTEPTAPTEPLAQGPTELDDGLCRPLGRGKSSVFALIERFYEATGGRILVDGRDVRD